MLKKSNPILRALKDSFIVATLGFVMIGPMVSFILSGYTVDLKLQRLPWLFCLLFLLRFLFILLSTNPTLRQLVSFINKQFKKKAPIEKLHPAHPRWIWVIALIACILPLIISKYWLSVAILSLIYILLGLGLNIVVGLAGLLNLGFVAFYAIGAYTFALGAQYLHISFWLAIPFAALLAGLFGALLAFPVLRMYGDYLAIVTLGFGEIVRLIINNWASFTGGPNGVQIPKFMFFGTHLNAGARYIVLYLMLLMMVGLTLHLINRIRHMPLGRAFEALREDEIACRSLGIYHVSTKLWAFSLGAMIGGMGGVFFAALEGFVDPGSFTFMESALILSIVVFGGMGSNLGVVLAALILTLLPEVLREFSGYRMLIFGALMVMMMIWRPQGLIKFSRFSYVQPKQNEPKQQ
ncbi:MAG: branched-chain amino acid ABC transporter permease [Proteobacteria bacterium]|nr:branched-chain amino acid ABC transporter permease [Pseudomonadota bacterium]